ncbi:TetR/AcrR family transcriptional regulator C-terminal domain-containing protein [Paenibacillus sp. JNUCC31]|uniref:TetR/AcrR family transcriptional regulator n=1 Tax=Paenibacillus sp. JNUCC-31 TaxID=2777983 RepID=UPI00177A7E3C|nr:TetR/AcrR family transcriptional regulator [Paenibacillus sp. JNUCC-31]QOS77017.1 TetR/AcrR family transcriptional regulator C-terminal domain-containing protein [Paenibacillus sp. JNUCC-31]
MKGDKKSALDPRIVRTRQLIRGAFVELLKEMDIEKMSVNKIAKRATISRVTFYLHYNDITDMLEKIADEMIQHIEQIVDVYAPEFEKKRTEEAWPVLVKLLEHFAENSEFYQVVLTTKRTPIFTERLLKLFSRLVQAKNDRVEVVGQQNESGNHKEIAIWYGSSALIGTIDAWLRHDMPYSPHYLAKRLILLMT